MYYIVETTKSFEQAKEDLKTAVKHFGFGVLGIHELGDTLRNKGVPFNDNCSVFEVCNPVQAGKVLAIDIKLNMALPCRISVYTEKGLTKIGLIKPMQLLTTLSQDKDLIQIAQDVEDKLIQMVDKAK